MDGKFFKNLLTAIVSQEKVRQKQIETKQVFLQNDRPVWNLSFTECPSLNYLKNNSF